MRARRGRRAVLMTHSRAVDVSISRTPLPFDATDLATVCVLCSHNCGLRVGVGGQANHMDAPFALGFLRGLGSRKWFNAFAQEKTQHSLMDQWMFNASPATWLHADAEHARFMLVLGTNPKISNRGHNATDT